MDGSGTVLGDLAQATSPAAVQDWAAVRTHLGRPEGQIEELTRGYRVPAQVIDFAARLLPHIAPELRGPASFRQSADAHRITRTAPAEKIAAIVATCAAALAREGPVGVIAADDDIAELHRALSGSGVRHTVSLNRLASQAEQRGLQRPYVALTRAVSSLRIIHTDHLPEPLVEHVARCG